MPKYLITFNHTHGEWEKLNDEQRDALSRWHQQFSEALRTEQGTEMIYFASPVEARSVRLDSAGTMTVGDAPSATAREFPGGFYVVDVPSIDDAIEWAKRGRWMVGSNEVREIVDLDV